MFQNVRIEFTSDLCKYFALYSKIFVYRCMSMFYKKNYKTNKFGFKYLRCVFMFHCYISMDNRSKTDSMKGHWVYQTAKV